MRTVLNVGRVGVIDHVAKGMCTAVPIWTAVWMIQPDAQGGLPKGRWPRAQGGESRSATTSSDEIERPEEVELWC